MTITDDRRLTTTTNDSGYTHRLVSELWIYIAAGFVAQMIDGILGMAYGVTATTLLLSTGVSPAVASASVHAAEVVTTGLSGWSHFRFGNIDRRLLRNLMIPGVLGAVAGAYILTSVRAEVIKPFVASYLLLMGILILTKARRREGSPAAARHLVPLGLAGGFFDAVGGGGWGPIVGGTLLARGSQPRMTIGSVNLAEFFVAFAATFTFLLTIGLTAWRPILGLALGGAIAAPLAGYATSRVPSRPLLVVVGSVIILLSLRTLYLLLRN